MKAIVLPADKPELLTPLSNWTSDYLMPVVNKPVAEHLIELLLENNIREIIFILNHQPYETEEYFKAGERWGCNISYSLVREYHGAIDAISRIKNSIEEGFICFPVNMITNLDIAKFVNFHNETLADLTLPVTPVEIKQSGLNKFRPFIMSHRALCHITNIKGHIGIKEIIKNFSDAGLKSNAYKAEFHYSLIESLKDYVDVNRAILKGEISHITIPGKEIRKGLWIGRNSFIDPAAEINTPALIGENCSIKSSVSISEYSIIGDGVIVDSDSSIKRSIICEKTYVGTNTEINDSIVNQNFIFNLPAMSNLYVDDDTIIGNMEKNLFKEKLEKIFNIVAALFLFCLFTPVMLVLYIYHLLCPSKRYLDTITGYGGYGSRDMKGNPELSVLSQYYFKSSYSLIRKLPGLINVIKGDIRLVGNSILSEEENNLLREDWQKVRLNALTGLIHLWETEKSPVSIWEERMVSENFYASTRSFRDDIMILFKYFFHIKNLSAENDHQRELGSGLLS
ncbi:MAG: sugar transferase [Deltaproteobacteria bacterium]|nr:sugar transferase [Deltaproteobacteria bacterium]